MAQRICPKCGHVENEYTFFCTECGERTVESGGSAAAAAPRPRTEPAPEPAPAPRPAPAPAPEQEPTPGPMPEPEPEPGPMPGPEPEPMPGPMPTPKPPKASFQWKKQYTYIAIGAAALVAVVIGVSAVAKGLSGRKRTASFAEPQPAATQVQVSNETTTTTTTTTTANNNGNATEQTQQNNAVIERYETESQTSGGQAEDWGSALAECIEKEYGSCDVAFFNLNGDDKEEVAVFDYNGCTLLTVTDNNSVDRLTIKDSIVSFREKRNIIGAAYNDIDYYFTDTFYGISGGYWEQIEAGECHVGYDENYAEPFYSCYINGAGVDMDSYFNWQSQGYSGGENVEALEKYSAAQACSILRNAGTSYVDQYSIINHDNLYSGWDYSAYPGVCIFIAPTDGVYEFELKGGAGGADGQRVLEKTSLYDGNGAILDGTMQLTIGDRVVIVNGGAGGVSQENACVIAGGFNGGGDTYWSGGGGGSTDLYYRGTRVAAAAGAGGGNFGSYGEPGRSSTSSKTHITDNKKGGSTGSIWRDDVGAGGGGGWYGGQAGGTDEGGYGGISGYDGRYFRVVYENDGKKSSDPSNVDGYTKITRMQ